MLGTNSDCYNQNFSRQLWKFGVAEKEELSNVAKPKKPIDGKLSVRTGHSNVTATALVLRVELRWVKSGALMWRRFN